MAQKWHPDSAAMLALKKTRASNGVARSVLACLCLHANKDLVAWPAVGTMCNLTGFSERSVQRALRELEDLREIVTWSRQGGRKKSAEYWICLLEVEFGDRENPVTVAPFQTQKGATQCGKGATQAGKGATQAGKGASVAPEPFRTLNQPIEPCAREAAAAQRWAANMNLANIITNGRHVAPSLCTPTKAAELVALGLVPEARMREVGLL